MDSLYSRWSSSSGVSPFRNLRVNGYLLLTAAFRSLSRLSSALSAKAFTLCSLLLDLFSVHIACLAIAYKLPCEIDYSFLNRIFDVFSFPYVIFKVQRSLQTMAIREPASAQLLNAHPL